MDNIGSHMEYCNGPGLNEEEVEFDTSSFNAFDGSSEMSDSQLDGSENMAPRNATESSDGSGLSEEKVESDVNSFNTFDGSSELSDSQLDGNENTEPTNENMAPGNATGIPPVLLASESAIMQIDRSFTTLRLLSDDTIGILAEPTTFSLSAQRARDALQLTVTQLYTAIEFQKHMMSQQFHCGRLSLALRASMEAAEFASEAVAHAAVVALGVRESETAFAPELGTFLYGQRVRMAVQALIRLHATTENIDALLLNAARSPDYASVAHLVLRENLELRWCCDSAMQAITCVAEAIEYCNAQRAKAQDAGTTVPLVVEIRAIVLAGDAVIAANGILSYSQRALAARAREHCYQGTAVCSCYLYQMASIDAKQAVSASYNCAREASLRFQYLSGVATFVAWLKDILDTEEAAAQAEMEVMVETGAQEEKRQ